MEHGKPAHKGKMPPKGMPMKTCPDCHGKGKVPMKRGKK